MDETFAELGKVFRTVTKIVREKTEDYFGNLTPLQRVLRDVADEDTCTVPNSLLRDIAKSSHDPHSYSLVMQTIWQGLTSESWQWRRIYKSLSLLEYMLLLGPPRTKDDVANAIMTLRNLISFRYHDGQREHGGGVRQRADHIVHLLENPDDLETEKQKALQDAQKYVGIENKPTFPGNGFFGGNHMGVPSMGMPTGNEFFTGAPEHRPHTWGELGGEWRNPQPTSSYDGPNPFNTINRLQTVEQAQRPWEPPLDSNKQNEPDRQVLPSAQPTKAPKTTAQASGALIDLFDSADESSVVEKAASPAAQGVGDLLEL